MKPVPITVHNIPLEDFKRINVHGCDTGDVELEIVRDEDDNTGTWVTGRTAESILKSLKILGVLEP